jgi:hypothetical protein
METKRIVAAMLVAFAFLAVTGYLVDGWLAATYAKVAAEYNPWRPTAEIMERYWLMWIALAFFAVLFVWIYTRGLEAKPWVGQAIRYGIVMTLFYTVPVALDQYVVYRVPYTLAIIWGVVGAIQVLLLAFIVGAICRKKPAAA